NRMLRWSAAIRGYAPLLGDSTSLASPWVNGFAEGAGGRIWIADGLGGLVEFDPRAQRFRAHSNADHSLNVMAVAAGTGGEVWLGLWMGGLGRYRPETGTFETWSTRNSAVPGDNIFAVFADPQGPVWAGTAARGLFSFDPATGQVRRYRISPEGQAQSQIWLIRKLHDGRLALGTQANGLVLIDPASGRLTPYLSSPDPRSLVSNDVRALLETEPGVLWAGTGGGLERIDLLTGVITHYQEGDGLPSDYIAGLALDTQGRLWASSGSGIFRFDPRSRATLRFTPADGLQGRHFNPASYLQARNCAVYFGGNNGFNVIRPERLTVDPIPPPVVITGLRLFNRTVEPGARGSPLRQAIEVSRRLVLKHGQSVVTLEFAALDFNAPERNQYAYRLEGFDQRWTDAGTRNTATFTGLPPGDYVFRVKASNGDGVWNEQGASLSIRIQPAFWQTWWFRVLCALLAVAAIGLTVLIVRRRQRRLAEMNRKLAEAAERDRERQRNLQGQVLDILSGMRRFATGETTPLPVHGDDAIRELRGGINRILSERDRAEADLRQSQKMEAIGRLAGAVAHDFNNLLTVMQGNTSLVLARLPRDQRGRSELEEVKRATERAGSLTRQLLAFSRKQVLQPRPLSVNALVRDLSRMLRRSVGEDVDFRLQLAEDAGWVYADPGQLEQVLLNLVVNARDAMPRGGVLTMGARRAEPDELRDAGTARHPYVALYVSDTGIGIPPEVR
ncbi:MAG TPA: triple tyrosine motif-containing protein, partial [Longimicrobiales bacterium]